MTRPAGKAGHFAARRRLRQIIHVSLILLLPGFFVFLPIFLSGGRYFWIEDFITFWFTYPFVAGFGALIFGFVWGQIGSPFGIRRLFWSDDPWSRFFVGFGITLYFSVFWTIIFYDLHYQFASDHVNSIFNYSDPENGTRYRVQLLRNLKDESSIQEAGGSLKSLVIVDEVNHVLQGKR